MRRKPTLPTVLLIAEAVVVFVILLVAFYPGIVVGPDINEQLAQARGEVPFYDWHPPLMALIWRAGIAVTGAQSSLFLFEITLFVGALFLFAWTGRRRNLVRGVWPYLILLIPLFPPILALAGRLWKDQLLTFFVLFGVAVLFSMRPRRRSLIGVVFFLLTLAVATLLRGNGIFAVVFLFPLAWSHLREVSLPARFQRVRGRWVAPAAVVAAFLIVTITTSTVVEVSTRPVKTHQIDQIFLDDLLFAVKRADLERLPVSEQFRADLLAGQQRCRAEGIRQDAMWGCGDTGRKYDADGVPYFPMIEKHNDEFASAWAHAIPRNLPRYLLYRTDMFSRYLFETHKGLLDASSSGAEKHEVTAKYSDALSAVSRYTDTTAKRLAPILFSAGFWLVWGLVLIGVVVRNRSAIDRRTGNFALYLSLAGVFMQLSLFPIVPAPVLRYAYFSIVVTLVATCLYLGGRAAATRVSR